MEAESLIEIIEDKLKKYSIAKSILEDLPEWFGIESALNAYLDAVKELYFIAYKEDETYIGFATLEETSSIGCDVHVLGVFKIYHGKSIGTRLMKAVEYQARLLKKRYITVKTLSELHADEHYAKTRRFYEKIGYQKLETFRTIWDESNPCDYYIKALEMPQIIDINSELRLRSVSDSDYKTAVKWYENPEVLYYSENMTEGVYTLETVTDMYNYLRGIGTLYFIERFESNWKPIGDVTLSPKTMPICIGDPTYYNQGIGKQVIKRLIETARDLGYPKIDLYGIYKHNIRSYQMFKSCGFELIHEDEEKWYLSITLDS